MRTQIMCSSSQGDHPLSITWLRDDTPISNTVDTMSEAHIPKPTTMGRNQGKDYLPPDPTLTINQYAPFSSILSIHNVSSLHNGNYTCNVANHAGSVQYTAALSVSVPPRWILKPIDHDAILGSNVMLSCQADGFPVPTIQWKKSVGDSGDYQELKFGAQHASSPSFLEVYNNGSLIITKVGREHENNYLCQAFNGIGAGLSTLVKLTVHVGPSVSMETKRLVSRRGERITIRCEAFGDRPLEIFWSAKTNPIDPTHDIRYHIKKSSLVNGVVSEFSILETSLTDRGEYSCMAKNSYGIDKAVMSLQVQEPPKFPVNLHVLDLGSRSVTLAWLPNEQGSALLVTGSKSDHDSKPISNYILQYKKAEDVWHEHINQHVLPGDRTTAHLNSLKPANAYHIRLYAENNLGTSAPSDILFFETDSEIPSAPPQDVTVDPLDSQQLLITWRAPIRDSWNGNLLGFIIAYQKHGSSYLSVKNYTKISSLSTEGLNDFRLIGLEKYTHYAITVSAFNIKGEGPPSKVVLSHTLEDTPTAHPTDITCLALTSQNIQVSWQSPPKELCHGIVQGYKILYEPVYVEQEYNSRETKITSALNTVLHGLHPFTNYSVQVLAFTRAGDGLLSPAVTCITEEAVPDAPKRIKSVVSTVSSVIVSWLPPRHPNGLIAKYTIYIRILEKGQELKILKEVLSARTLHFEAKDLDLKESYEAWVTASTRVGQGPSTPVIKLVPSSSIPAAIISFSQSISVSWRADIKLACIFVGNPKVIVEWKVLNIRQKKNIRLEVNHENTLHLRNVERWNEGNYSCTTKNSIGSDQIVYQVYVQVPPSTPIVFINTVQKHSISLQWRVEDFGGTSLRGFTLTYRHDTDEWVEIVLEWRANSYVLENLRCGTRYQFFINSFNKIGISPNSAVETAKTKGNKPIAPVKYKFIHPNITSIILDLSSWDDGGCPILYFSIEFKIFQSSNEWIIVSNKVETKTLYNIGDLEAGTAYNLRVTAYNNAGPTTKEFYFQTHTFFGSISSTDSEKGPGRKIVLTDVHLVAIIIASIFGTILALIGAFICFKNYPRRTLSGNGDTQRTCSSPDKVDNRQSERSYGSVPENCPLSLPEAVHDRIPEFSEDIYPYATFHLPEHENQSGNVSLNHFANSPTYDLRLKHDNTSGIIKANIRFSSLVSITETNCNDSNNIIEASEINHTNTNAHCSKFNKSESEEYDSLNSDNEISRGRLREDDIYGRDSLNHAVGNTFTATSDNWILSGASLT
ncbi:Down syndrome cell adhesion molecule-like protein Dscam2 [Drosophila willistoni]|uniref:Down syndrome cell adhesion molecule-like protein Dscam2 n=1 Tax=Drosophila willistoni TaxID=7260 RepID=UPI001F0847F4|nr:Down syndrome cell adhesion molecule-like protein Dscam2 [Drosophila willistoni]